MKSRTLDRARSKILNEDVRAAQQGAQKLHVGWLLEIEHSGFLALIEPDEISALTMHGGVVLARKITCGRFFDFDDASARFREPRTGIRSGYSLLDRNDQQAIDRGGRVIVLAAGFSGISDASHGSFCSVGLQADILIHVHAHLTGAGSTWRPPDAG